MEVNGIPFRRMIMDGSRYEEAKDMFTSPETQSDTGATAVTVAEWVYIHLMLPPNI